MRRWIEFGRGFDGGFTYNKGADQPGAWFRMPYKSELFQIINLATQVPDTQMNQCRYSITVFDPDSDQHQIKEGCQAFHYGSASMPLGPEATMFQWIISGFLTRDFQQSPPIFQFSTTRPDPEQWGDA